MKKLLLFVAALLFAAGAMAQDIWLGAERTNSNGYKYFTISKNGTVLETHQGSQSSFVQYDIPSLIAGDNGEVYYLKHVYSGDVTYYTDLYKHDGTTKQLIFNCPTQQDIFLRDLYYDRDNGDIYACGTYRASVEGCTHGYITKNEDELYRFDVDYLYDDLYGIAVVDGHVFTCGGKAPEEGWGGEDWSVATIWRDGQEFASYPGEYGHLRGFAYDIVHIDNVLYICGTIRKDGEFVGALWRTSIHPASNGEIKELTLVKTFEDNPPQRFHTMCEDAYFLYLVAYDGQGPDASTVLKFSLGSQSFTNQYNIQAQGSKGNVVANNQGVFIASELSEQYYKNNQVVTTPVEGIIRKIAVTNPMNAIVYDLPFTENFEYGSSHWHDWWVDDEKDNGASWSYWHRGCVDGNICVLHPYNGDNLQIGDLYSPALRIPQGSNTTLRFRTMFEFVEDIDRCELWIVFNEDGGHISSGSYQIVKKWEVDPDEFVNHEWEEVEIDLTPYAGEIINLDFYYKGRNACNWYIDDVEVFTTPTGVEDALVANLAVYPNPANDHIVIEGLQHSTDVEIFNTLGELVKTVRVSVAGEVSIADLSAGLYVVRCGETSLRFVKE